MNKLHHILAAWLALAVILTSATELRPDAFPAGPGEALLGGWMLFMSFLLLRGLRVEFGTLFQVWLLYWLAATALLGLGAVVSLYNRNLHAGTAGHDALAFLFVAILTCLLALRLVESDHSYRLAIARYAFFFFLVCGGGLLLIGMSMSYLGPIELWYGGVRFSGWARNPNQLALFALPMPFLGWFLLRRTSSLLRRVVYVLGIAACIGIGLLTQSDALRVAWVGAAGIVGAAVWFRAIVRARGATIFLSHLLVPIALLIVGVGLGDDLLAYLDRALQRMYAEGDQGETRIVLWGNGIEAIMHSPVVGLGPGAYSGSMGPFYGSEAHNSLIDWGMSTGLAGILLHLTLLGWAAWRALRAGEFALLGLVGALAAFSLFGYMLRHPMYWLLLVLVLTLSERRLRAAASAETAAHRQRNEPAPQRPPFLRPA